MIINRSRWKEYRSTRAYLLAAALVIDMILWSIYVPLKDLLFFDGEASFRSAAINMACFLLDAVVVVMMSMFICEVVSNIKILNGSSLWKMFCSSFLIFALIILTSSILADVYYVLGWEYEYDTVFTILSCTIISLFVSGIYHTMLHQNEILRKDNVIKSMQRMVMTNNHFVFNCLAQLKALIKQDPDSAEEMVDSMSDCYKQVVKLNKTQTSSILEEYKFSLSFMDIMKKRFPAGFSLDMDKNISNMPGRVPTMSFQVILENVFKHNIIDESNPIHIKVWEDKPGFISFENNVVPRPEEQKSSHVGHEYLYSIYGSLSSQIEILHDEKTFKITIPVIK